MAVSSIHLSSYSVARCQLAADLFLRKREGNSFLYPQKTTVMWLVWIHVSWFIASQDITSSMISFWLRIRYVKQGYNFKFVFMLIICWVFNQNFHYATMRATKFVSHLQPGLCMTNRAFLSTNTEWSS